jgi:hypothetical protein
MKRLLYILPGTLLLYLATFSCVNRQQSKAGSVGILVNMDMLDSGTGSMFRMHNDTILVCNLKDVIMYRQSVDFIKYNEKALKNGRMEVTDDTTTMDSKTKLHRFYVYTKNQKIGLMYDSLGKNPEGAAFNLDSLLKENPVFKEGTTEFDKSSALFSKTETKNCLILEKYVYKVKPDPYFPDTICFFFDKKWKSEIQYTLSRSLDSITKMKLVRVNFIFNPIAKGKDAQTEFPERGLDVRLFKPNLNENERREIDKVFQAYERQKKLK